MIPGGSADALAGASSGAGSGAGVEDMIVMKWYLLFYIFIDMVVEERKGVLNSDLLFSRDFPGSVWGHKESLSS